MTDSVCERTFRRSPTRPSNVLTSLWNDITLDVSTIHNSTPEHIRYANGMKVLECGHHVTTGGRRVFKYSVSRCELMRIRQHHKENVQVLFMTSREYYESVIVQQLMN
jgi:hypothetical protein